MNQSSYQKFLVRASRLYALAATKIVERPNQVHAKALSSVARFSSPPGGALNVDITKVLIQVRELTRFLGLSKSRNIILSLVLIIVLDMATDLLGLPNA